MINIAVAGYGVVGAGVVEVFYKNKDSIINKIKQEADIKYILDIRDFSSDLYANKFCKDFETIINDTSVKIFVEAIGGISPAYEFTKRCLSNGISVVTSNKELVAVKGHELISIAAKNNTNYLFEASVGGGIPIIRPITQCLAANEITEIYGILNGTTNFILTKMLDDGISFDAALALAQSLGYAESDPTSDIEGHDTCRKICILSALAFGKHVYPHQVHTEGITNLSLVDAEYLATINGVVKLLGRAKREGDKLYCSVFPAVLKYYNQLSNVNNVFNAICIYGDATDEVVFYGKGAGKYPTASAMLADIIDCAKHIGSRKFVDWADGTDDYILPYNVEQGSFYIRGNNTKDIDILKLFNNAQKLVINNSPKQELCFTVTDTNRQEIDKILNEYQFTPSTILRIIE